MAVLNKTNNPRCKQTQTPAIKKQVEITQSLKSLNIFNVKNNGAIMIKALSDVHSCSLKKIAIIELGRQLFDLLGF